MKNYEKIKPVRNNVLIRPIERVTDSDILLLSKYKEGNQDGCVEAVGVGIWNKYGYKRPMYVKSGQKVLFASHTPRKFKVNGETMYMMDEQKVLGYYVGEDDIVPFGDQMLVEPFKPRVFCDGIIHLPDSVNKVAEKGTVLKLGAGVFDDKTGKVRPIAVEVGQEVYFKSSYPRLIKFDSGREAYLLKEEDILGWEAGE